MQTFPPNTPLGDWLRMHPATFSQRADVARLPVYTGKDPSRALATSSLRSEDCVPEWHDLEDQYKTILSEWYTFFSKRYNVVGKVRLPAIDGRDLQSNLLLVRILQSDPLYWA